MPIEFHVVAVDVLTGEELLLSRGPVLEAVLASAAIPGCLAPVAWEGRALMDGGVANNTPISHAVALGARTVYVLRDRSRVRARAAAGERAGYGAARADAAGAKPADRRHRDSSRSREARGDASAVPARDPADRLRARRGADRALARRRASIPRRWRCQRPPIRSAASHRQSHARKKRLVRPSLKQTCERSSASWTHRLSGDRVVAWRIERLRDGGFSASPGRNGGS